MSDFKYTNLVVQSNSLILQTNWKLNTVPLKVFKVLISCIDTKNPPENNLVSISKYDLNKFINGHSDVNYTFLRKQVKSLQSQVVEIKDANGDILSLSILPKVTWKKSSDEVVCEFGEDLMPYLINLKENFTIYNIMDLKSFSSKYGIMIYEYLKTEQFKTYSINKNFISIDDLKIITGTVNIKSYSTFEVFDRKVLKIAKNDINNSNLEFLVDYDKVYAGRKINGIRFKTRPRKSYKDISF